MCLYGLMTSFKVHACGSALYICRFTVKEDPDFGPFLESVNGIVSDKHKNRYWEILSERSGEYNRLAVGEYPPSPE